MVGLGTCRRTLGLKTEPLALNLGAVGPEAGFASEGWICAMVRCALNKSRLLGSHVYMEDQARGVTIHAISSSIGKTSFTANQREETEFLDKSTLNAAMFPVIVHTSCH